MSSVSGSVNHREFASNLKERCRHLDKLNYNLIMKYLVKYPFEFLENNL